MKSLQKFKTFEALTTDPEVLQVMNAFKANPKKYFFDPKTFKDISEEDLQKIAENYLDFPFRLPPREEDLFTGR